MRERVDCDRICLPPFETRHLQQIDSREGERRPNERRSNRRAPLLHTPDRKCYILVNVPLATKKQFYMKEFYFNLEQTKIECRAALQYLREGSPLSLCFYKKALNDISGRAISPSDLLLLAGTQHDAFSNISH